MRSSLIFLSLSLAALPVRASAQGRPVALADSDLLVAGVAYGADSAAVRAVLGRPTSTAGRSWGYAGLRISFQGPRVRQITISSSRVATSRGLRIGDPISRITELYGPSCSAGAYNYCRTVGDEPDERGILVQVKNGLVSSIHVGAVFALD